MWQFSYEGQSKLTDDEDGHTTAGDELQTEQVALETVVRGQKHLDSLSSKLDIARSTAGVPMSKAIALECGTLC